MDALAATFGKDDAPTSKDLKKIIKTLNTVIKLTLMNAQHIRLLRSIVLQVTLTKKDHWAAAAIKEGTVKYSELASNYKGKPEERISKIAVPHLMAFNYLLQAAVKNITGDQLGILQDYVKKAGESGKGLHFYTSMKTLRLEKAFEKGSCKIISNVAEGSQEDRIWKLIRQGMLSSNQARALPGVAPPGHFENVLQEFLQDSGTV